MCGLRQLFFQCGLEMPKGWAPLLRNLLKFSSSLGFTIILSLTNSSIPQTGLLFVPFALPLHVCYQQKSLLVFQYRPQVKEHWFRDLSNRTLTGEAPQHCCPYRTLHFLAATFKKVPRPVSYTHLTLPTRSIKCRSRWSPYH